MVSRQASDLYIKTEVPPMLRIANQLMPVGETPLTPEAVEQLAGQLMQARHRKEFEERQQVNLELLAVDRKSTRLNSSHEWNSYAVFCLKKKKKKAASTAAGANGT